MVSVGVELDNIAPFDLVHVELPFEIGLECPLMSVDVLYRVLLGDWQVCLEGTGVYP